ncbi:MAG: hypothetical protein FJZ96_14485 [Chloroflexi bacterium]|nr:hypothetical protein [Chloroflexota bacterium]
MPLHNAKPLLPLCAIAALTASCSNSTSPQRDQAPPVADVSLSVVPSPASHVACPVIGAFRLNPMGSSDDITPQDELQIRWDFENDGVWDTDFEHLSVRLAQPRPLPVDQWTMRCEVKDQAGNARVLERTVELPDWLPVPDDVLAGAVRVYGYDDPFTAADTLRIGQPFEVGVWHREWMSTSGVPLTIDIYIDGALARSITAGTSYPNPERCCSLGVAISGGIKTAGLHEVRFVLDAAAGIAESNEDNNTAVTSIVVVE